MEGTGNSMSLITFTPPPKGAPIFGRPRQWRFLLSQILPAKQVRMPRLKKRHAETAHCSCFDLEAIVADCLLTIQSAHKADSVRTVFFLFPKVVRTRESTRPQGNYTYQKKWRKGRFYWHTSDVVAWCKPIQSLHRFVRTKFCTVQQTKFIRKYLQTIAALF